MSQLFKLVVTFSFALIVSQAAAQLNNQEYDEVDFLFDSVYSYNYQQYLKTQDSLSLVKLYTDLNQQIDAEKNSLKELSIKKSSIQFLPEKVTELQQIESVVLWDCKRIDLKDAFEKLAKLPNLKSLTIINSNRYSIPDNIALLKNLEYLNIKQNKIVLLPDTLTSLTKLSHLVVSNNSLINEDYLFPLLVKIPSLKILEAEYCQIREIPKSATSIQFEKLNLQGNLLSNLPANLKVKQLNIASNPLMNFDNVFLNLPKDLTELDLSYNKIIALSKNIGSLTNLKYLNLQGNELTTFPAEIGNLTYLKVLIADNKSDYKPTNKIALLPSAFTKLRALEELYLANNLLKTLPSDFSALSNLKHLDLSWNKFEAFPKGLTDMPNLKHLDLSVNTNISTLPENIGNMKKLEYLDVSANFFNAPNKKIKNLPVSITTLANLKVLILNDNVIEALPENIHNLKKLERLEVRNNLLSGLPNSFSLLSNLEALDLKANELKKFPTDFYKLKNLAHLNLSFNFNMEEIDLLFHITKMKNLSYLNIADCWLLQTTVENILKELPNTEVKTQDSRRKKED